MNKFLCRIGIHDYDRREVHVTSKWDSRVFDSRIFLRCSHCNAAKFEGRNLPTCIIVPTKYMSDNQLADQDEIDPKIDQWKKEVIKWQDTDTENQEVIEAKDAEIKRLVDENKRLKKGFGDMTSMLLRDKDG